ncbi:MAG TPA: SRPBCC domain-containing protein [Caulobacter sp.]|nr:SRPBCC domain-containing protein [Caulobacter sp.]
MSGRDIDLAFELEEPPEKVWRALTEPALLARWLGPNDFRAEPGAVFTVGGAPGAANDNATARCEVLTLEPGRRLRLSWKEGVVESLITFTLEPGADGGSRLRLTHDGFVTEGGLPAVLTMQPAGAGDWRMQWAA